MLLAREIGGTVSNWVFPFSIFRRQTKQSPAGSSETSCPGRSCREHRPGRVLATCTSCSCSEWIEAETRAVHKNKGDHPIMSILGRVVVLAKPRLGKQILVCLLSWALLFAAWPQNLPAYQDPPAPAQAASAPPYMQQTPEQLQQLAAPIALYPDSLVAQILAASTFPEQVVGAERGVQGHPALKRAALG